MQLQTARLIQIEVEQLVEAVKRDDPIPLINSKLLAILTLCHASLAIGALPRFFLSSVPDGKDK